MMRFLLLCFTFLIVSLASPLKEGEVYEAITIKDQFERDYSIEGIRCILFSGDKTSGEIGHEAISRLGAHFLDDKKIAYISDMSGIPSLVYTFFMEDKFKSYPYRLGLIWERDIAAKFPKKETQVTVLLLEDNTITSIKYFDSTEDLEEFLKTL